ncbi:hypothetical protein ACTFIW_011082 [Dictyostelium discoideum]
MSTSKKIKTDNNNKIFQDIIDFEIIRSIINYLLISKKRNNNNFRNISNNQYKISNFFFNINEILNFILVSKKWYSFISLTISNNIINNKSFEYWLKTDYKNNNKSFIEIYNNQNQYDKNNILFKNIEDKQNIISFNKEFSIIKIKESIIEDYFKFNLFLNHFTVDAFKEIKNKFENNKLLYNRIVVNVVSIGYDWLDSSTLYKDDSLFTLYEYVSNENSEIISNLFKILELNFNFWLDRVYRPGPEKDDGNKKCTELYFNNLSIDDFEEKVDDDEETVKIFKIFKGKNIIYDGYDVDNDYLTHINYSALFDPHNSGHQVESIEVKNKPNNEEFVEAYHLIKVNQFENLHSITIPINPFRILSNLSKEMGFCKLYRKNNITESGDSKNMKSELNQMINSFITCKSLKNLNISSVYLKYPISKETYALVVDDQEILAKYINEAIESFSNCFQPLFSELNTSIERIEFDCCGLLNINTFSNLLNNKSIKYLYLYDHIDDGIDELHLEPISIYQYLFDNIFSSPLTSIRHYKINIEESKQLKLIFNLILNNIFKLQLYSLIFQFGKNKLIGEFVLEFKNLINNISTQQQEQQLENKSNYIILKEFKIKIKIKIKDDEHILELNNINNPYFAIVIKKIS